MSAVETRGRSDLVSFTPPQIALIKRTICRPKKREATEDELYLFIGQCKRTGLDPFSKQIYAIFRWDSRLGQEVMTVQTAIDGFRVIAERTGSYMGKVSTHWCGQDEEWKEVWLDASHPAAARVIVRKFAAGHIVEIPAVAHWDEYVDDKSPMWKEREKGGMPANQLAKCSEALALRQAFPNDLSGLYTLDEMAQADAQPSIEEPADAEVVEQAGTQRALLSGEDHETLAAAIDGAGIDEEKLQMLLVGVGVDCTEDLDKEQYDQLLAAIAQQMGGAQ